MTPYSVHLAYLENYSWLYSRLCSIAYPKGFPPSIPGAVVTVRFAYTPQGFGEVECAALKLQLYPLTQSADCFLA